MVDMIRNPAPTSGSGPRPSDAKKKNPWCEKACQSIDCRD